MESRAHVTAALSHVDEGRGFFSSLFDLSFTSFITTRLIKLLYAMLIVLAAVTALALGSGLSIAATAIGGRFLGLLAFVIVGPVVFLVNVILARVMLEGAIVFFRMAEHTAQIARQGR